MRFTIVALFAIVSAASVVAAPPPEAVTDGPNKVRPANHHVAKTEQQQDIDMLRAEVQRLRVEVERCKR